MSTLEIILGFLWCIFIFLLIGFTEGGGYVYSGICIVVLAILTWILSKEEGGR